jgi:REP element-mobilizing transposase RayT
MEEDKHIIKRHNKNLLLYHFVCPIKYRKKVLTKEVELTLKNTCEGIGQRYEIYTVELGIDEDHVHFLIQSVPSCSPTEIIRTVKSITAKKIFKAHPEVKKFLWGGQFWTGGYYVNTVGQYSNFETIQKYVQNQGKKYKQIYRGQLKLF